MRVEAPISVAERPIRASGSEREIVREHSQSRPRGAASFPQVSPTLLRWFTWYSRRFICRHFHSLRISTAGFPVVPAEQPVVLFANHASWWDPLVCLVVKQEMFPSRTAYAPIDAAMLGRYRFFTHLGFFPVEQRSLRGAAQFLATAEQVLARPDSMLAITPQSRFVDVRERPVTFAPGLGHLARRVNATFLPVATEYVFWEERLPEILVRFGSPIHSCSSDLSMNAEKWTRLLEQGLEHAQDELAEQAGRRDSSRFRVVLRGGSGQGGVYDVWRGIRARLRGESFKKEHGHL